MFIRSEMLFIYECLHARNGMREWERERDESIQHIIIKWCKSMHDNWDRWLNNFLFRSFIHFIMIWIVPMYNIAIASMLVWWATLLSYSNRNFHLFAFWWLFEIGISSSSSSSPLSHKNKFFLSSIHIFHSSL
jgi:hypothetical protein